MSDLIKRFDAIKAFVEETNGVNVEEAIKVVDAYLQIRECDEIWDSIRAIRDCLECAKYNIAELIPSAEPKTGEWEEVEDYNGDVHYKCNKCGVEWVFPSGTPIENNANFCPKCGADMRGEEE